MNCLLGCCKMTFMSHLIFTSLAGMIFRPHFTTFCTCFVIIFLEKHFFRVQHMLQHMIFYEFLSKNMFSRIHFNFVFIIFLNGLPHSMHGTWCFMKFSKLKIVFNILNMNYLLGFRKMTFTIPLIFTSPAGMKFRPLFTTFCSCFVIIFLEKHHFFAC